MHFVAVACFSRSRRRGPISPVTCQLPRRAHKAPHAGTRHPAAQPRSDPRAESHVEASHVLESPFPLRLTVDAMAPDKAVAMTTLPSAGRRSGLADVPPGRLLRHRGPEPLRTFHGRRPTLSCRPDKGKAHFEKKPRQLFSTP